MESNKIDMPTIFQYIRSPLAVHRKRILAYINPWANGETMETAEEPTFASSLLLYIRNSESKSSIFIRMKETTQVKKKGGVKIQAHLTKL